MRHEAVPDDDFRTFVRGSQGRIVRFAELLVRDPGHAEDLAQEAYARAFAAWPRVRGGDPESYVRRCVLNGSIDRWRRGGWRQSTALTTDPAARSDHAETTAARDQVMRALMGLTPRERAVIALRYYSGLTEAQVAHEMGMRIGTVKSTCARATAKLRVSPHFDEERQVSLDRKDRRR